MLTTNAFAEIGSLIGDPARASMVVALMDGRALTATELSAFAGVTPQTASSHLSQLVAAGLLAMERQAVTAIIASPPRRSRGWWKG